MTTRFKMAMDELLRAEARFKSGELGAWPYSKARETWLGEALCALAEEHGCHLRTPMYIDALGELSIVAVGGPLQPKGAPTYGDSFAALVSRCQPRTGTVVRDSMAGFNAWCQANHFAVERMLIEEHNLMLAAG